MATETDPLDPILSKLRSMVAGTARLSPREKAALRDAARRGGPFIVPAARLTGKARAEARAFLKELDTRKAGPSAEPSPEAQHARDELQQQMLLRLLPEMTSEIAKEGRRLQRIAKKRAVRKGKPG